MDSWQSSFPTLQFCCSDMTTRFLPSMTFAPTPATRSLVEMWTGTQQHVHGMGRNLTFVRGRIFACQHFARQDPIRCKLLTGRCS